MQIFPAIDLIDGQAVRLVRGDYEQKTVYGAEPVVTAKRFCAAGATALHVVDLDGAKSGAADNFKTVCELIEQSGMDIEIGGGIRDLNMVETYLSAGAWRVILGSAAVDRPRFSAKSAGDLRRKDRRRRGREWTGASPSRGWLDDGGVSCEEFCAKLESLGAWRRSSAPTSPATGCSAARIWNFIDKLTTEFPKLSFIASGGVSTDSDIATLKAIGLVRRNRRQGAVHRRARPCARDFDCRGGLKAMLAKRIIPCLDVQRRPRRQGRQLRGPVRRVLTRWSWRAITTDGGADELVFYDITASAEDRALFTDILNRRRARASSFRLTVGGGINYARGFRPRAQMRRG